MATLDDQFLYGKAAGYCSSSDEDDGDENNERSSAPSSNKPSDMRFASSTGSSVNTGPKGVIEDWRRFKQLQIERRHEQENELVNLAKKLSMTCRSTLDDEKAKKKELEEDLLKELDDDDDFTKEYIKRRMLELSQQFVNKSNRTFGLVYELSDIDSFLDAVEEDSKQSTVVLHIFEKAISACETMNGCFVSLAQSFPTVKFCRVLASVLGTSKKFRSKALPTVQVYRDGHLIGNFVRIDEEFGLDFFADDVECFLKQYGALPDSSCDEAIKLSTAFAANSSNKKESSDDDD